MQPMRTLLFVPANRESMVEKALTIPADVIVLDLEDAVPPAEKEAARRRVRAAVESLSGAGRTVHVRVNALATGLTRDDLAAAIGPGLHGLLFPKVEAAADIRAVDVLIREQEMRNGVRPGTVMLVPMIESARAVLRCEEIAQASTRIGALALGGEDYATDLGVPRTDEGRELEYVRRVIVHVAAAYRLQALDGIYATLHDEAGLIADAAYARSIGFKGKYVIHPEQVGPVNQVFTPTEAELEAARRIVQAFDEAIAQGHGTVQVDGRMIDIPIATRARELIAYAEAIAASQSDSQRGG
ncbi:MAG TPA: CoA ester lyase [Dehalococcoidia bacterium]|nr:CoA ester lyase [Dehalococcoidia bacterium]